MLNHALILKQGVSHGALARFPAVRVQDVPSAASRSDSLATNFSHWAA